MNAIVYFELHVGDQKGYYLNLIIYVGTALCSHIYIIDMFSYCYLENIFKKMIFLSHQQYAFIFRCKKCVFEKWIKKIQTKKNMSNRKPLSEKGK